VLQLRRCDRISIENRRCRFNGANLTAKFYVVRVAPPTILLVIKVKQFHSIIRCKNVSTSFFRIVTITRLPDGRTDGGAMTALHSMQRGKNYQNIAFAARRVDVCQTVAWRSWRSDNAALKAWTAGVAAWGRSGGWQSACLYSWPPVYHSHPYITQHDHIAYAIWHDCQIATVVVALARLPKWDPIVRRAGVHKTACLIAPPYVSILNI